MLGAAHGRAAGVAPEPAHQYFRADRGVAVSVGRSLPERFDDAALRCWRVAMDPGHSTPALAGSRLFLTTYRPEARELATVAVDAATGAVLWKRVVATGRIETVHDAKGNPATPSPACDGERVFVFFGSYGLVGYDLEGQVLWERPMGPFRDEYGAGSSPIVAGEFVILQQDHDIDSFLMALDRKTGRAVWKRSRPDAVRSYSTPAVWMRDGRQELLAAGALQLTSYDLQTGEPLWWFEGLARIVIPVPIAAESRVYAASWAPGGDAAQRIALDAWTAAVKKWDGDGDGRLGRGEIADANVLDRFLRMDLDQDGRLDGDEWERHAEIFRRAENAVVALEPRGRGPLGAAHVVWKHGRGVPYVATPVVDQGRLWMVKDGGIATQLDAATGKLLLEERLPGAGGNYYASPVAGDGNVYFASENGVVTVLANEPDWRVISQHDFRERIYATPFMARGRAFLRTEQAVYCYEHPNAKPAAAAP
jgi:outer membrane protein assembly factor BamB